MNVSEFINKKQGQFLKGKPIKTKDISRKGFRYWLIEAVTFMKQSDTANKIFVIERMKMISQDPGCITKRPRGYSQYRIGYYVIGQIGNKKGKWTWGQYCPHIPLDDFWLLIEKATREGTILQNNPSATA
ncbi:MAG: hypothetical protein WCI48_12385 [Bacteroidota bacterium]